MDLGSTNSTIQVVMVENAKSNDDLDTIFWNFWTISLHRGLSSTDGYILHYIPASIKGCSKAEEFL